MLKKFRQWFHIDSSNTSSTSDSIEDLEKLAPLVLYKFDACPYCKRVQNIIDSLQIQDKIEMRDTRTHSKWKQDLYKRTGTTQVPCLFVDGKEMFESLDIVAYLKQRFSEQ